MPRNVIFFAPVANEATLRFVRAVAKLDDVRLLGVVIRTPVGDDARLYDDLVQVTEISARVLIDAIEILKRKHGPIHRIIGTMEETMIPLAAAREHFGVPGTPLKTATLFREKAQMKDALRAAGLPVAKHQLIRVLKDAQKFADDVGFPMVVKPPDGVGGKQTYRVSSITELLKVLQSATGPMLAEEMLRGREHSFDTVTVKGVPRIASISNYVPACLEAIENPWIQWACVLPREIDLSAVQPVGFGAIKALGLDDGMTHMEWFAKPDGTVAIGEIAARPPGPQLCQMTGLVHDMDPYKAWARAVVDSAFDAPWERKFAAGTAFIRSPGRGRIVGITGVRETHEAIGDCLVEAKLPTVGAWKNESYEGDGYVVVRHPSTEKVQSMLKTVIETLRVRYAA